MLPSLTSLSLDDAPHTHGEEEDVGVVLDLTNLKADPSTNEVTTYETHLEAQLTTIKRKISQMKNGKQNEPAGDQRVRFMTMVAKSHMARFDRYTAKLRELTAKAEAFWDQIPEEAKKAFEAKKAARSTSSGTGTGSRTRGSGRRGTTSSEDDDWYNEDTMDPTWRQLNDVLTAKQIFEKVTTDMGAHDRDLGSSQISRLVSPDDRTRTTAKSDALNESKWVKYYLEPAEKALEEIIGLPGAWDLKGYVASITTMFLNREEPFVERNLNALFLGQAGIGKTTGAELVAKVLHAFGMVHYPECNKISASELVGSYTGETPKKVLNWVLAQTEHVAILDEVYQLAEIGDFGKEAINQLVYTMSTYEGAHTIFATGYASDVEKMLEKNEGFSRRWSTRINFAPYNDNDLLDILDFHLRKLLGRAPRMTTTSEERTAATNPPSAAAPSAAASSSSDRAARASKRQRAAEGGTSPMNTDSNPVIAFAPKTAETYVLEGNAQAGFLYLMKYCGGRRGEPGSDSYEMPRAEDPWLYSLMAEWGASMAKLANAIVEAGYERMGQEGSNKEESFLYKDTQKVTMDNFADGVVKCAYDSGKSLMRMQARYLYEGRLLDNQSPSNILPLVDIVSQIVKTPSDYNSWTRRTLYHDDNDGAWGSVSLMQISRGRKLKFSPRDVLLRDVIGYEQSNPNPSDMDVADARSNMFGTPSERVGDSQRTASPRRNA